ncbi:MAG: PASTA domain-containing protein, partial [Actinomycetota bacterium]
AYGTAAAGGPHTTKLSPSTQLDFVPYGSPATPPWGIPAPEAVPDAPAAPRRHSRWAWVWLPVMAILIGGITFDIVASWQKHNATVVEPQWANANLQAYTAAARHLGLNVKGVPTDSAVEAGTVLSATPKAGSHLKKGSTITLSYSRGNEVTVDNVESSMAAAATSTLQGQGLNPVQSPDSNSSAPAGTVTNQDPAPWATAVKGSTVTLTVSSPQPSPPPAPAPAETCSGLGGFLSQLGIGSCTPTPPSPPDKHHNGGGGGGGQ